MHTAHAPHMHHSSTPHMICRSPEEFAEMRVVYERKLQLATELGNLEGLPPLSAALAGTEHPALRRMPKTGAFVHLNEVTPPRTMPSLVSPTRTTLTYERVVYLPCLPR